MVALQALALKEAGNLSRNSPPGNPIETLKHMDALDQDRFRGESLRVAQPHRLQRPIGRRHLDDVAAKALPNRRRQGDLTFA